MAAQPMTSAVPMASAVVPMGSSAGCGVFGCILAAFSTPSVHLLYELFSLPH